MPPLKPVPSTQEIVASRNAKIDAQIANTQLGGGEFQVASTSNADANEGIKTAAAQMSKMQQVLNAQETRGGRRRKRRTLRSRRSFRRRKRRR